MFSDYKDVVSPKELQAMLGIGRNMVYELLRANIIPSIKIGRKYIVTKQAVIAFIEQTCYNEGQIIGGGLRTVEKGAVT